jgi:hypothetical protein
MIKVIVDGKDYALDETNVPERALCVRTNCDFATQMTGTCMSRRENLSPSGSTRSSCRGWSARTCALSPSEHRSSQQGVGGEGACGADSPGAGAGAGARVCSMHFNGLYYNCFNCQSAEDRSVTLNV